MVLFACGRAEDVDFRSGSTVAVQRVRAGEAEVAYGFLDVLEVDGLLDGIGAEVGEFPFRRFVQVFPSGLTSNWYLSVIPEVFPSCLGR